MNKLKLKRGIRRSGASLIVNHSMGKCRRRIQAAVRNINEPDNQGIKVEFTKHSPDHWQFEIYQGDKHEKNDNRGFTLRGSLDMIAAQRTRIAFNTRLGGCGLFMYLAMGIFCLWVGIGIIGEAWHVSVALIGLSFMFILGGLGDWATYRVMKTRLKTAILQAFDMAYDGSPSRRDVTFEKITLWGVILCIVFSTIMCVIMVIIGP